MNHGHVTPNPGGLKARCGGPGLCAQCSAELAALTGPSTTPTQAPTGTGWPVTDHVSVATVEAYIKTTRDRYNRHDDEWDALNDLLDDFRDHLYTGTPFDRPVTGPHQEG